MIPVMDVAIDDEADVYSRVSIADLESLICATQAPSLFSQKVYSKTLGQRIVENQEQVLVYEVFRGGIESCREEKLINFQCKLLDYCGNTREANLLIEVVNELSAANYSMVSPFSRLFSRD